MAAYPEKRRVPEPERWLRKGHAMSEEGYHELERLSPARKYEYLDGLVYMMRGGSVGHDAISFNIRLALVAALRSGPCRAFGSDVQVLVGTRKSGKLDYVYPDVTVSCDPLDVRIDTLLIESARVVVEVLSPGTEAIDRRTKFRRYQRHASIQEIILVSQFAHYVEVWQRNEQDLSPWDYRHYEADEIVEIQSIGMQISVADVYQGIDFIEAEDDEP